MLMHVVDHWQDVSVGSALGLLAAFFCYRQYYPALSAPDSHIPFAPRTSRPPPGAPLLPTHAPYEFVGEDDEGEEAGRGGGS